MADIALIITSSIFAVLVLFLSFYFIVYFQHPDDRNTAWVPKVIGISVAIYNVLLLPLDVANHRGEYDAVGGIPMATITVVFFIMSIILSFAIVPFMMFYYEGLDEADEENPSLAKQITYAAGWTFTSLAFFFLATGLLWHFLGYAQISTVTLSSQFSTNPATFSFCTKDTCQTKAENLEIPISFTVYMIAIASFVGWLLFTLFGGVGLAALPLDLILGFLNRPRPISNAQYLEMKKLIGEQAAGLLQSNEKLLVERKSLVHAKFWKDRKYRRIYRKEKEFKRDVLFLDSQYQKLEDSYRNSGGNPIIHFTKLIVGFLGGIISFFWFLHILLYVLPVTIGSSPVTPFLNTFFSATFSTPVFGITFYGIFVFWLLACVFKGLLAVGMRFLFFSIFPIKVGETMMNSMLFNTGIMLIGSLAVSQFSTLAFGQYARYTSSLSLFGNQLETFLYINYVYDALIFAFPSMTLITAIYLAFKPKNHNMQKII